MKPLKTPSHPGRLPLFLGLSAIILTILFWHDASQALIAIDSPLHGMASLGRVIRDGSLSLWTPGFWLGNPGQILFANLQIPILAILGASTATVTLFVLGSFLSGLAMFLLLRTLGLSAIACIFGGLAMLLSNTALTLVYAGHINKVYSYPWMVFACAFFLKTLQAFRWRHFAITGAFLGIAVLSGEIQMALYTGLWFVAWTLIFAFWRRPAAERVKFLTCHALGLTLLVGLTLVVAFQAMGSFWQGMAAAPPTAGGGDTAQNWRFATQFFFPPEELISYLTTIQFFGAPQAYWGRDGAPTPLRLSDDYMGLLPLGFAVLGGIACWRIWQARLFIFMALGSLLISFGREGGLFWLLYQLPTMKSQRNPHRWSYFVSLAVCVLAAYGVNWLISQLRDTRHASRDTGDGGAGDGADSRLTSGEGDRRHETGDTGDGDAAACGVQRVACSAPKWSLWKRALLAIALLGGALFVVTGALSLSPKSWAGFFYASDQMNSPQAPLLVERARCMLVALMRTGLFLAASALATWWVVRAGARTKLEAGSWKLEGSEAGTRDTGHETRGAEGRRQGEGSQKICSVNRGAWSVNRQAFAWLAVLLVLILDLGLNAKRYIQFYPWKDVYEKNELVNFLRQDKDFYRIKVLGAQQNPLLNQLVSNILPYHRIPVVDPMAASRIPNDYAQLFEHIQNHYTRSDRYFDFFNVKYLLSPGPFADPITPFTLVAQWNGIHVYQRPSFLPRAWLASSVVVVKEGGGALGTVPLHESRFTPHVPEQNGKTTEAVIAKTMHPETDLREVVVMEEAPQTVPLHASRFTPHETEAPSHGLEQNGKTTEAPRTVLRQETGDRKQETRVTSHESRKAFGEPPNATRGPRVLPIKTSNDQPRTARLVSYEDNRLSVETEASIPTMLVMSEKWDPDWKAWVDGQPAKIYRANFLMRAVELPAGKHTVRMEYRPSTVGFWISAVSVGLFALYGIGCGLTWIAKRGARNS